LASARFFKAFLSFQSRPWPPRAQPCPGQESPHLRYRPPAARGPLRPRPLLSSAALRDAPVPARRQALPHVRRFRLPWELYRFGRRALRGAEGVVRYSSVGRLPRAGEKSGSRRRRNARRDPRARWPCLASPPSALPMVLMPAKCVRPPRAARASARTSHQEWSHSDRAAAYNRISRCRAGSAGSAERERRA
jgi:hypothetical protein